MEAETVAPVADYPQIRGWESRRKVSSTGWLIILCAVVALVCFVRGLTKRKARMVWMPLWLGCGALLIGLLGTVMVMIETYSKIASLGGAANPADLAEGISESLVHTFMGLIALLAGGLFTFILWLRKKPQSPTKGGED